MNEAPNRVVLRDSTLREGLDVPGVRFQPQDGLRIARELVRAGIVEAEVVAPARVLAELPFARMVREENIALRTSGLIYAARKESRGEIEQASKALDHFDLLMPLSEHREPKDFSAKKSVLREVLRFALSQCADVGAGISALDPSRSRGTVRNRRRGLEPRRDSAHHLRHQRQW